MQDQPRRTRRRAAPAEAAPAAAGTPAVPGVPGVPPTVTDLDARSPLSADDLYLFNEGSHVRLYDKLGAHVMRDGDVEGTHFAVWAPDAERVSVIGDFNGWERGRHPLSPRGSSGIWAGFIPGVGRGAIYKYFIASRYNGYEVEKADPLAFATETPPHTASIVWDLEHAWDDAAWMAARAARNALDAPISIYEVHIASWMHVPEEGDRSLTYRELAPRLADHVAQLGFTHVEFLPVMEHPFGGSWGYQTSGYFAPTSRFGTPQDFMYLIDYLHQREIGVILDWVPSHFPSDEHSLGFFDGTYLYEHADPRRRIHPDWGSLIFNYSRPEVRAFLTSSAMFWLDRYHADGLRLDAVASMLYLDYSREAGEWAPNEFGGREDLAATDFLRRLNAAVYESYPDVQTIAEESTAWPMVSRPTYLGGLGFGLKWDMGWMHDTLEYFKLDPVHRRFHHHQLTFRMVYAFTENFCLPLSHDEVVHGKGSLLRKMPGDDWQKFANLRLLYAYMYAQPGKKMLFMGDEFAQWDEWSHESSLQWHLLAHPPHEGMQRLVGDLNRAYRDQPALHVQDHDGGGFAWLEANDADQGTLAFARHGRDGEVVAVVCNLTPVPRHNYRVGVPHAGAWRELVNTDSTYYGGSGQGNLGTIEALPVPYQGHPYSLNLTVPPLGALFLAPA